MRCSQQGSTIPAAIPWPHHALLCLVVQVMRLLSVSTISVCFAFRSNIMLLTQPTDGPLETYARTCVVCSPMCMPRQFR